MNKLRTTAPPTIQTGNRHRSWVLIADFNCENIRFVEPASSNFKLSFLRRFSFHLSHVLDDARCYGVGGLTFPGFVPPDVVIVVNEADFCEDGRHDGAVDDQEVHVFLDAPVGQFQHGTDILLYGMARHDAVRGIAHEGLRARSVPVECVEMDRHEEVGLPAVGVADDAKEVIVLLDNIADSVLVEAFLDKPGKLPGQLGFRQGQMVIDGSRVTEHVMAGIEVNKHIRPPFSWGIRRACAQQACGNAY